MKASNLIFAGLMTILAVVAMTLIAEGVPDNYRRSLYNTLVHEGGARYTNHPNDPGGPTKYGITIHDVRKYIKRNATAQDVRNLTQAQAERIYRERYWHAVGADGLAKGLDYSVFDYAVNAGTGRALPTLRACQRAHASVGAQIRCVNDRRMAFQMGLGPRYNVFKRGWRNRINSVRKIALEMHTGPKAFMLPTHPSVGPGKAYDSDVSIDGVLDLKELP